MSEKIEDVAKAMWDVRRAHANNEGIFLEFWGDGTIPKANGIMEEARAAIEAMRYPDEVMIQRAYEAVEFNDCWQIEDGTDFLKAYYAVIDEALK